MKRALVLAALLLLLPGCIPHGTVIAVEKIPAHTETCIRCEGGYGYRYGISFNGKTEWSYGYKPCATYRPDSCLVPDKWSVVLRTKEGTMHEFTSTRPYEVGEER